MQPMIRNGLLAVVLATGAGAAALPAGAAPVPSAAAAVQAAAPGAAAAVRYDERRRWRHAHRRVYRGYGPPPYAAGWGGPDTVGSLGYTPYGYAYNRFSGQRYQSCVFDEGYGRVRPCDAGRGR